MSLQTQQCLQQREAMPPGIPPAGSCAMRLEGLEKMSDKQKKELMEAISTDIRAFILCLHEHIKAGNIDAEQTESFDQVVKLIQGTDVEHRKMLTRRVWRLRKERHLVRKEYREYFRTTEILALAHKSKVQKLDKTVKELLAQVVALQEERELLHLSKEKKDEKGKQNENEERDEDQEDHSSLAEQHISSDHKQDLSTDPDGDWAESTKYEAC